MRLDLDVHEDAELDLIEHFSHLRVRSDVSARRFLASARETFEFLCETPGAGALYHLDDPDLPALRKWPVKGFPMYLIFYRDEGRSLSIVRVIHGARDIPAILRSSV